MLSEELLKEILGPGNITIAAGRPAMGKTAFAISLASELNSQVKTAYITLDLTEDIIAKRFMTHNSNMENIRIYAWDDKDIEKCLQCLEDVDFVVIDYMQLC